MEETNTFLLKFDEDIKATSHETGQSSTKLYQKYLNYLINNSSEPKHLINQILCSQIQTNGINTTKEELTQFLKKERDVNDDNILYWTYN